jgi:hypothetical protein
VIDGGTVTFRSLAVLCSLVAASLVATPQVRADEQVDTTAPTGSYRLAQTTAYLASSQWRPTTFEAPPLTATVTLIQTALDDPRRRWFRITDPAAEGRRFHHTVRAAELTVRADGTWVTPPIKRMKKLRLFVEYGGRDRAGNSAPTRTPEYDVR